MSTENYPTNRTRWITLLLLLLLLAASAVVLTNGHTGVAVPRKAPPANVKARVSSTQSEKVYGTDGDYSIIVTRNLFHVPATKSALPPPPIGTPPLPVTKRPPATPAGPHIAYTGMVELPYGVYFLLENIDTNESVYTAIGGKAFDYSVMEGNAEAVVLDKQGVKLTLKAGENKPEPPPSASKSDKPAENGAAPKSPTNTQPAPSSSGPSPATSKPGGEGQPIPTKMMIRSGG